MQKQLDIKEELSLGFYESKLKINNSLYKIELYKKQIQKLNQAVKLLLRTYATSGKNFEEVLKMQQSILKYQIKDLKSKKDIMIQKAKIRYLIGNKKI